MQKQQQQQQYKFSGNSSNNHIIENTDIKVNVNISKNTDIINHTDSNTNNKQQSYQFYIDSHTHLLDYDRESILSLDRILSQSIEHNVQYIVANSCCSRQFQEMEKLGKLSQQTYKHKESWQNQQNQQKEVNKSQQMKYQNKSLNNNSKANKPIINIITCYGIHPCYICQQGGISKSTTIAPISTAKFSTNNIQQQQQQIESKQQKPTSASISSQSKPNISSNQNISQQCTQTIPQSSQDQWKKLLRQYLINHPDSHVGQIGLDFRKDVILQNPIPKQWQFFQFQFQLAIELKRSVTIHCVRSYNQLIKYFKSIDKKYSLEELREVNIVLHSYGGNTTATKQLLKLNKLNIYFSLSLQHSKDILDIIPVDRIIAETDAPYQSNWQILIDNLFRTKQQLERERQKYNRVMMELEMESDNSQLKEQKDKLSKADKQANQLNQQQQIKQQKQQKQQNEQKNQHSTNLSYHKTFKPLLKQCKFFNKSVLDNKPINVIANYKELSKYYKQYDYTAFRHKITQNALKAFKLIVK